MTVEDAVRELRARLHAAADPSFADGVRNFFREPVDPWGVRTADLQPLVRYAYSIVKSWPAQQRNKLCDALWHGRFEEGVLVCHLYRRFKTQCTSCEFKLFERWIDRYVQNWAHCDGVSSWLLSACIENDPSLKDQLRSWTSSRNRWKRRAAAVALLQEAKKGRSSQHILEIAQLLRGDADLMVQKGVGWLLKEAYPKRPDEIVAFLSESEFPRLVVRYAAEKMAPSDRALLLLPTARHRRNVIPT